MLAIWLLVHLQNELADANDLLHQAAVASTIDHEWHVAVQVRLALVHGDGSPCIICTVHHDEHLLMKSSISICLPHRDSTLLEDRQATIRHRVAGVLLWYNTAVSQ